MWRDVVLLSALWGIGLAVITMHVSATIALLKEVWSRNIATVSIGLFMGIGGLLSYASSTLAARFGFKIVFLAGIIIGAGGAAMCVVGTVVKSNILILLGPVVQGLYWTTATLYRFAGMEAVPKEQKSTAASIVVFGGVTGALLGPQLAVAGRHALPEHEFAVSYIIMGGLFVVGGLLLIFYRNPKIEQIEATSKPRPLITIITKRTFLVCCINGTISYSMMTVLSTGVPLAMLDMGFVLEGAQGVAFVIQMHFVSMFLPATITPILVKVFGPSKLMLLGCVLFGLSYLTYFVKINYATLMIGSIFTGLGWTALFVGATVLLPTVCAPHEKPKVTAVNEFFVFATTGVGICLTGTLVDSLEYPDFLIPTIPFIAVSFVVTLWLVICEHRAQLAPVENTIERTDSEMIDIEAAPSPKASGVTEKPT